MNKVFYPPIPKIKRGIERYNSATLDKVIYESETYFDETMLTNIDYLFTLDTERLLYNYRLNAGLPTGEASSYGGWISTQSGGAGQFEAQYVGALARYTLSKPDYVSITAIELTNTPLKRLKYMLLEMRKCQLAYSEKYQQNGYLSAFTHLCMKAVESGTNTTPNGVNVWVPFYMYHKNLMMCYDVYQYVTDEEVRSLALTMLKEAGLWVYNEISSLSEIERQNVLKVEYGGMSEVMYLTYGLTEDSRYLKAARFFEEENLLKNIYEGNNVFPHKHTNTHIPKILACSAAYNVLGDEYYKEVALKAWEMIVEHMTYANGGVSLNEHFEEVDITSQGGYAEETCCSYNMLRLTDYIFKWTGEKKYAEYFENVFYNQIMASIDPVTGGKTYPISTAFGYYKIYSDAFNSFWCCCCTGQETFSKLNWGIYYKNLNDNSITINMYNPSTYEEDDIKINITGNLFINESVRLSVKSSKVIKLRLRIPNWCDNMTLKLNGEVFNDYVIEEGYLLINRLWDESDDLIINLPMDYHFVSERGYEEYKALFYGPLMLVAKLEDVNPSECIASHQSKDGTYGGIYLGELKQTMIFDDIESNYKSHITKKVKDDKLIFTFKAKNQTVTYVPFMDCYHARFSMYMAYVFNDNK